MYESRETDGIAHERTRHRSDPLPLKPDRSTLFLLLKL